ncbi:MAG TPA: pyrroline-5-carboxylate reductase [Pseudomonadales bacterium]
MTSPTIAFIGAGNMAQAMIGGMIANGIAPAAIRAADPFAGSREAVQKQFGIHASEDNRAVIEGADVVILAVKPQQMQALCIDIRDSLLAQQPLLISIAAGIRCAMLESWLDNSLAIVRCMPNTPALVQKAASALYANPQVSTGQRQLAGELVSSFGSVDWVADERLMDAVTALSGSGPAYFFLVMQAMMEAGEALGLAPEVARNLTLQTALGAADMASTADVDVAELRRRVTSPGGTTEAAIACFEQGGLRELFLQALNAADARSKTLAEQMQ